MARRSTGSSVAIQWSIENFNFCWHKTGERFESPSFNIKFSGETSWRLWLYPRGEDDGEYMSFYLFREEGGPDLVHIDFQLYVYVADSIENKVQKSFIGNSFNIRQREGLKCFALRWKFLAPQNDHLGCPLLHFGCIILNRGKGEFNSSKQRLHTRIEKEHIYGNEVYDDNAIDIDENCSKEIEVKPALENEPLIKINLTYFEDGLLVKILPVNCKKIKYAICKIKVIINWEKESTIEYFRSWIGEVKADIWRYSVLRSGKESSNPNVKKFIDKLVFVRHDFAFSTGEMEVFCGQEECSKYLMTTSITFLDYSSAKSINAAPTALESLEQNYRSWSFVDVYVRTRTEIFPAHKAILCGVRSLKLKAIIGEDNTAQLLEEGSGWKYFFLFLYTGTLEKITTATALGLYKISLSLDLEPLESKCRTILLASLNIFTAAKMFNYVWSQKLPLRTDIQNYIAAHYNSVINCTEWEEFSNDIEFRKELILLKYKNQERAS